jgi:hypothetical protein
VLKGSEVETEYIRISNECEYVISCVSEIPSTKDTSVCRKGHSSIITSSHLR